MTSCSAVGTDVYLNSAGPQHLGQTGNRRFIVVDTFPLSIPCDVDVAAWELRFSGSCSLAMQVWTSINSRNDQFTLLGQNKATVSTGSANYEQIYRINVDESQRIHLKANSTVYFGITSNAQGCYIDDSSDSTSKHTIRYLTWGADLFLPIGSSLTSFNYSEVNQKAYFRAILKGEWKFFLKVELEEY